MSYQFMTCVNCAQETDAGEKACPECGARMAPSRAEDASPHVSLELPSLLSDSVETKEEKL